MPKVNYLPADFGKWVEETGFPPNMKCQIEHRTRDGKEWWNVTKDGKLAAQLFSREAEVYSPDVVEVVVSLATQFEDLFFSKPSKDGVTINCRFPKFAKKDQ
jgi:hypothetical protein